MAGVVTTVIADALKTQALTGVVDTTFRNDMTLGRFPQIPDTGGVTINVKVAYGSNTSVGRYNEGDAAGTPGAQSYATAQWPFTYYKCVVQFTGHARDQLNNGSPQAAFFNQLAREFEYGMKDIIDLASTDALGTGLTSPIGIQGIADSAGTIAGLSRSTFTWWQSYETTYSTTVTLADLDASDRFSRDRSYGSKYDQVWAAPKQIQKLRGAIGLAGQSNNSIRIMSSNGGIDLAGNTSGVTYAGRPVVETVDLTDSVLIGIQSSDLFSSYRRQMQVDLLGKTDDSDKYLITMAIGIGAYQCKHFWKNTGYTA